MLASVAPSHTIARTLIEFTRIGCAGPRSRYSSWPEVSPLSDDFAFPPKLALSPLFAMIHPPSVMMISHKGVVTGSTQIFAAAPVGSPASCVPSPSVSAKAVMTSAPGRSGPWYVKSHWPLEFVVHGPWALTEPVTVKRTTTSGTGLPNASSTVAVTVWLVPTGVVSVAGGRGRGGGGARSAIFAVEGAP